MLRKTIVIYGKNGFYDLPTIVSSLVKRNDINMKDNFEKKTIDIFASNYPMIVLNLNCIFVNKKEIIEKNKLEFNYFTNSDMEIVGRIDKKNFKVKEVCNYMNFHKNNNTYLNYCLEYYENNKYCEELIIKDKINFVTKIKSQEEYKFHDFWELLSKQSQCKINLVNNTILDNNNNEPTFLL
jgi:hypothetical protein